MNTRSWVLAFLLLIQSAAAFGGTGITYYGRLLDNTGKPVIAPLVQFKIQIRSPGPENCLFYEEQHARDLSSSKGVFALTINDGTASVANIEPFTLDRVFQNRGTFTFAVGKCGIGTTYTPNPADGRKIVVEFNDGTFGGWEQLPPQAINYVPMSIDSMSVGGYNAGNLFRVVDGSGSPAVISPISQTEHSVLMDLIHGTGAINAVQIPAGAIDNSKLASGIDGSKISGNIGGNAAGFTGSLAGDVTGGQASTVVTRIQGRTVDSGAPGDGQALVWSAGNNRWQPGTVAGGGGAPTGSAGGDLGGTYPNPTIAKLQTKDITLGALSNGDVLTYDGVKWVNAPVVGGSDTLGGLSCVSGDTAVFNGSAWSCVNASVAPGNSTLVRRSAGGQIQSASADFGAIGVNNGSGSVVTIETPAAFTSYILKLPASAGTNGQILTSNGTDMIWSNASSITASNVSGIVAVANGGTGASTASAARTNLGVTATGDALVTAADAAAARTAISAMQNVAPGSNGNVLTVAGGVWTSAPFTVNAANVGSSVGGYFTYKPNNGACANGEVLKWETAGGGRWACGTDISSTGGTGVSSVSATAPVTVDNTDPNNPRVEIDDATTTSTGVVQLATSSDTIAGLVVQANDTRLTNSRAPSGTAGGDLTGNYPNPTIAKLQTKDITLTALANGNVLKYDGVKWVNAADADSLGGLSCTNGDVALYASGVWSCVAASATSSNNSIVRRNGSGVITSAGGNFGSLMVNNGTSTITLATPAAFTSYTLKLPSSAGTNGQYLTSNGSDMVWSNLSISPSNFASQTQSTVLAAPSGGNGTPTFRALAAADIPALDMAKITTGTLGMAQGGTGATTQAGAANAILPSQASANGKALVSNGTNVSWGTVLTAPAGSNTQIQFNSAGALGAASTFVWDNGNSRLGVGTTTPGTTLDVNGSARIGSVSIGGGVSPASKLLVTTDSAVSGSASATATLDAADNTSASSSLVLRSKTGAGTTTNTLVVRGDGNVGIGVVGPVAKLDVSGTIKSALISVASPATTGFDLGAGNIQYTSASCAGATWNLTNMQQGTTYTIVVQGNSHSGSCAFSDGASTFKYSPLNATPTASKDVIYSMMKVGSSVYVSWIDAW